MFTRIVGSKQRNRNWLATDRHCLPSILPSNVMVSFAVPPLLLCPPIDKGRQIGDQQWARRAGTQRLENGRDQQHTSNKQTVCPIDIQHSNGAIHLHFVVFAPFAYTIQNLAISCSYMRGALWHDLHAPQGYPKAHNSRNLLSLSLLPTSLYAFQSPLSLSWPFSQHDAYRFCRFTFYDNPMRILSNHYWTRWPMLLLGVATHCWQLRVVIQIIEEYSI